MSNVNRVLFVVVGLLVAFFVGEITARTYGVQTGQITAGAILGFVIMCLIDIWGCLMALGGCAILHHYWDVQNINWLKHWAIIYATLQLVDWLFYVRFLWIEETINEERGYRSTQVLRMIFVAVTELFLWKICQEIRPHDPNWWYMGLGLWALFNIPLYSLAVMAAEVTIAAVYQNPVTGEARAGFSGWTFKFFHEWLRYRVNDTAIGPRVINRPILSGPKGLPLEASVVCEYEPSKTLFGTFYLFIDGQIRNNKDPYGVLEELFLGQVKAYLQNETFDLNLDTLTGVELAKKSKKITRKFRGKKLGNPDTSFELTHGLIIKSINIIVEPTAETQKLLMVKELADRLEKDDGMPRAEAWKRAQVQLGIVKEDTVNYNVTGFDLLPAAQLVERGITNALKGRGKK